MAFCKVFLGARRNCILTHGIVVDNDAATPLAVPQARVLEFLSEALSLAGGSHGSRGSSFLRGSSSSFVLNVLVLCVGLCNVGCFLGLKISKSIVF